MQQHWAKRSKSNGFSEHVAYQTKGNHECSSMVANILPLDPIHPSPPAQLWEWGQRSKLIFFRICSLNEITNTATW